MFSYISCIYLHISNSNTTGVTCKAGTVNPSGAPEFTPVFKVGFTYLEL